MGETMFARLLEDLRGFGIDATPFSALKGNTYLK